MGNNNMARYFVNKFPEYAGNLGNSNVTTEREKVISLIKRILDHQKLTKDNCDGNLYVGLGGIAYMLYHVAKNSAFQDLSHHYLMIANDYINYQLNYDKSLREDASAAAFLLGKLGTVAVAAAVAHKLGDTVNLEQHLKTFEKCMNISQPIGFLKCGGDELFVGRAGVLCAAHWLHKETGRQISPVSIQKICDTIIESGVRYSQKHRSPSPMMFAYYGTEYLGAAHGLTSILQMLLCFPHVWQANSEKAKLIQNSIDFLLNLQQPNGNFPCAMDELGRRSRPSSEELIHWCHGAPGVVFLMAKSYLIFKDAKYLESCIKCADVVWKMGLLKKGPGICHGIAGSAFVFLLLYRLTQNPMYLYQSRKFAEFMDTEEFKTGARVPDCPFSLYEGLAGTVCFMADLLTPELSAFPFFDVY